MVPKEDLRKISILEYLPEDMLEKLQPAIELWTIKEKEMIFNEGSEAKFFYMVKRGKVLLERRISEKITASLGSIKSGDSFGWSALFGGESFTILAVSAEDCELFIIEGKTMLQLLNSDHSMGYIIMQGLNRAMKHRIDRMAELVIRAISEHPDFKPFI